VQPAPIHGWYRWCEVCVLAYLAYCGLKKIAAVEANLPDELAYNPIDFTK
jgi:hypothetical protein